MNELLNLTRKNNAPNENMYAHTMSNADKTALIPQSAKIRTEYSAPDVSEDSTDSVVTSPRNTGNADFFPAKKFSLSRATTQMEKALNPGTILGEQLRMLRTRLSLLQKQKGVRTILMTSTFPQEGKSFTSCALAGVIAQEHEKRVLIIDADLRKHGSGRDFGLTNGNISIGTTQVLQGTNEFQKSLLKSTDPEFWFLPSGKLPLNPSELLGSPKMEEILHFAAEKFDWVIVDGPPALALPDPCLIAPLCDAVVLIVRVKSTSAKLVKATIDKIGRERICGIVLNRQKQIHSSKYYYQYYNQNNKK